MELAYYTWHNSILILMLILYLARTDMPYIQVIVVLPESLRVGFVFPSVLPCSYSEFRFHRYKPKLNHILLCICAVSWRFKPISCTPLIDEQSNPLYLLQHKVGIRRHRCILFPSRYVLSSGKDPLSLAYLWSVDVYIVMYTVVTSGF